MRLVDGFIRSGILSFPLSALALPLQINTCEAGTAPVSQLFRLQQTHNVAVGVGEPGEFTSGNGDRLHQRFAAERSGLVEIGLQVVYLRIDRDVIMRFVPRAVMWPLMPSAPVLMLAAGPACVMSQSKSWL